MHQDSNRNYRNNKESRSSRHSQQLGRQASENDAISQKAHRRNESDSRIGLLRRQHTDIALARRSEMYRNSKVDMALGGIPNSSDFPSATTDSGEPILTDFIHRNNSNKMYNHNNHRKNNHEEMRRQVSLDSDLHTLSSSNNSSIWDSPKFDWAQRREKSDVELRKAELRSELDRHRIDAESHSKHHHRESVISSNSSSTTNNNSSSSIVQQVSWEFFFLTHCSIVDD